MGINGISNNIEMTQRTISLLIEEVEIELDMDVNITLQQLEEFMKGPDFRAAAKNYGVKTVYTVNDVLSFHYNSPEAQASLKHLALKQFHPKKRLLFYINKVNGQQAVNALKPQPAPELKESIIDRSSGLGNDARLLSFVIHNGASEQFEQRTFKSDTTVRDLKKALLPTKYSQVTWTTHLGKPINLESMDNKKISEIDEVWKSEGSIHVYVIHHSA